MNNNTNQGSQPLYPSISPPTAENDTNPFLHTPPPSYSSLKTQPPQYPSIANPTAQEINPFYQTPEPSSSLQGTQKPSDFTPSTPNPSDHPEPSPSPSSPQKTRDLKQPHHHEEDIPSSSSSSSIPAPTPANEEEKAEQWGTHVMGHPAVPTCHPDNKKAALWGAAGTEQAQSFHHPYLQYKPIEKSNNSPMESMLHVFNSWSNRAESMANNIWHNLKTGTSVSGAAWGKMNVTAKAITGGGFEALYKQSFATYPNEKLNKSFACYLSTSTGPVAGTLYLSNLHTAFCSDRPLSFTAPSGQVTWSYYKIMVPLGNIATINPVMMRENSTEKYIQIVTIDGHDFWFMGFVNYEKASRHLTQSISTFVASGIAVNPAVAVADEKPDKADY
ncbi:GEM-like protein 5 [Prunus avium]|uniref:GEM-like protein 5 n=1 Tax=Prunus avium TaxID=42229 RepID=A0A6P5T6Z2_PRUAV|nr:GEM-like protein 5 [Prunus avium]